MGELPAIESLSSDIIYQNMKASHSARQNYIAAKSSERIRRAHSDIRCTPIQMWCMRMVIKF